MTLALEPYARMCGPHRLLFRARTSGAWPTDFLALHHWTLERQIAQGVWQELPNALCGLASVAPFSDGADFAAALTVDGGLIRLRALHEEAEPGADCAYARCLAQENAPYYLELEGLDLDGSHRIPACFYDADEGFSTLSQKLEDDDPIASAGRLQVSLVDLEGRLSRAFERRGARSFAAVLSCAVSGTDDSLTLEDAAALPASGVVWIGREAIRYGQKDGAILSQLERAALGTSATAHEAQDPLYLRNPYFKGRWLTLKRAQGDRYDESDPVVYRGICDTLSPDEGNLCRFLLGASDATSLLDTRVGNRLPEGVLANAVCLWGTLDGLVRRGNDTVYLRVRQDEENETITALRLPPGIYLSDTQNQDHPQHLVSAIRAAFARALPGLLLSCALDSQGRLSLVFRVAYGLELLAGAALGEGAQDSALETLGFGERSSGMSYAGENGAKRVALNAERAPRTGLAPNCDVAVLDPLLSSAALLANLSRYRLFRLDDEFVFASRIEHGSANAQTTLSQAVVADETSLPLADATGFSENGGFVRIEDEIVVYGKLGPDQSLLACVRGAFNTAATAHAAQTPVAVYAWPRLIGLTRGLYASQADWHGGSTRVRSVGGSDYAVSNESGAASLVRQDPATFLLDVLNAESPTSVCGLVAAPEMLDEASVSAAFEDWNVDWASSFLRLVDSDETYRDIMADVVGSFNLRLLCDERGRLTLKSRSPALAHELQSRAWTLDTLCALPKLSWHEGENDPAIELDLDYDAVADSYASRLHEDRAAQGAEPFPFAQRETRLLSSRSLIGHGSDGRVGAGLLLARDLMRAELARQLDFAVAMSIDVAQDETRGLSLGDTRRFVAQKLPIGAASEDARTLSFEVREIERDTQRNVATLGLFERATAAYAGFSPAMTLIGVVADARQVVVTKDPHFARGTRPSDYFVLSDALCLTRCGLAAFQRSAPNRLTEIDETLWDSEGRATLGFAADFSFAPMPSDVLSFASYDTPPPAASTQRAFCYLADDAASLGADRTASFVYGY